MISTDHYLSAFARRQKDLPAGADAWTGPLREAAIARFAGLGFPTVRQEEWRKTSIGPILKAPFQPQAPRFDEINRSDFVALPEKHLVSSERSSFERLLVERQHATSRHHLVKRASGEQTKI